MKKSSRKNPSRKPHGHGIDAHTQEIKRYLGALSEHYQHGQAAIAEQFGGLNAKLDAHTKQLNSHSQMIGRIMVDLEEVRSGMREKIDRVEFNKLEKRLVFLEVTVLGGKVK